MKQSFEALKLGIKKGFGIFLKELGQTDNYTWYNKSMFDIGMAIGKISRWVDTIILGIRFPKSLVYRMSNGQLSTDFVKKVVTLIKNSELCGVHKKGTLMIEDNDMTYEQAKALTVRRYNAMMEDLADSGILIKRGVDSDGVPTINISKVKNSKKKYL
jgi:hypothetical protein